MMFRQSLNRAILHVRVETKSPLLIKAGDAGLEVDRADMCAVRTTHGTFGRTVYIPGASFKGVLRSTAEALLRGESFGGIKGSCEDPLDSKRGCGGLKGNQIYMDHCLSCRIFGSTRMKGRAAIRDLYPFSYCKEQDEDGNRKHANRTELRFGVSINRITGAVENGPFEMEMVPSGVKFYGEIALENYQTWQLGLLLQSIDELKEGYAQLGSGKSKGLGVVDVVVEQIVHEQTARSGEAPRGVGELVSKEEAKHYGLLPEAPLPAIKGVAHGLSWRFDCQGDAVLNWQKSALGALTKLRSSK